MIRKADTGDFNFFYTLYMHPAVNPFLLYEKMSREEFQPIYDQLIADGVKYLFLEDGKPVGMFKLIRQKYRNAYTGYLGGVAILPSETGKGFGKKMLSEAIEMAKSSGIRRIELSTATTNKKAIQLYTHLGFQQEGVLINYTYLQSSDRFIDEIMMALLINP